jgi:hypothetical protein
MKLKVIVTLLLATGLIVIFPQKEVFAQTPSWSQCPGGEAIVRCETYDCPKGDTNKDGACTQADEGGRLTDARNDSLCPNPISGCGEVHYFKTNTTIACAVRVKENGTNCNLYSAGNPSFSSPSPSPTLSPTPKPSPTATPKASPTPTATASSTTKGGLPETGPSALQVVILALLGFFGIYLYEHFKIA